MIERFSIKKGGPEKQPTREFRRRREALAETPVLHENRPETENPQKEAVEQIDNPLPQQSEEKERPQTPEKIVASIVVSAYNEEAEIGRLLDSLEKAWFSGMEVVISDDGSTDNTATIVQEYIKRGSPGKPEDWLILYSHENFGFSGGRNAGATRARGEYMFFLDADAPVPSGLIEHDIRQMQERELDIANHYLTPEQKPRSPMGVFKDSVTLGLVNNVMRGSLGFAGCGGIIVRREFFDKIGGYNDVETGDDLDIFWRSIKTPGARVGMIHGVKMPTNMRRFEENGYVRTLLLWTRVWLYYLLYKKVPDGITVSYEPVRK